MKLTELEPEFVRYEDRTEGNPDIIKPPGGEFGDPVESHFVIPVATLAEAQGIWFLCPVCFLANKGKVGTHLIAVGFEGRGLLPHQSSQRKDGTGPSRWAVSGTGFEDLSTTPSIDSGDWHGYITNGEVSIL